MQRARTGSALRRKILKDGETIEPIRIDSGRELRPLSPKRFYTTKTRSGHSFDLLGVEYIQWRTHSCIPLTARATPDPKAL